MIPQRVYYETNQYVLCLDTSTLSCPLPELIMTEADNIADPDSEDEPERKDSLDVHEEGKSFIVIT